MKIEEIKKEYSKLSKELEKLSLEMKKGQKSPDFSLLAEKYKEKLKRFSKLQKIMEKINALEKIEKEIKENEKILEKDEELKTLAEEEIERLKKEKKKIKNEIKKLLEEKKTKENEVIVEIRAGVGGEEAALFARDLFEMYKKFCQKMGWKIKILESHFTDLGGIKEISFEVEGKGVKEWLSFESGVHRVQRIPETEKMGRIHTSTASVVVLEKPEEKEIELKPSELKIETFRASGPGGQYVNRRESAVRITHIPTGITAFSQDARTQIQNRENALRLLKARLYQFQKQKIEEKMKKERKEKIGKAMRAEKIRTYNFPQNRVTDHRIKKSWQNLKEILEGDLKEIIETLRKEMKKE